MGKIKNLEKKVSPAVGFDKNNPDKRVKSLNDAKLKKNLKATSTNAAAMIQKVQKKKKRKILKEILKEVELETSKGKQESESEDNKLVKREIVKKAIIAAKDGIKKEIETKGAKNLFDDETRFGLQVIASKIPVCPPHVKKILLPHSIYDGQPDICFIIKDQIPKKADQDECIRNFEEKLKEADIHCVKTIIPLSKLKQDYQTHNLRIKLCNTYDIFLVESEIGEHAYSLLGKHFIVKRKRPLLIDTKKTEVLKTSIEKAAHKVNFKLNSGSNISCFEVGTIKMDNISVADNVMSAIEQLKSKWPGGHKNIYRLYLKPMKQSKVCIPLHYSKINPNDVEIPIINGAKLNRYDKLADKLKKSAKKLRLDILNKRLVKTKSEKKDDSSNKKKSKDKKMKPVDKTLEVKEEEFIKVDEPQAEPSRKRKNKGKASLEVVNKTSEESIVEPIKKKKKQQSEPVEINELAKAKNKKKKSKSDLKLTDAPVEETVSSTEKEQGLKKKKKNKDKKNKKP